MDLPQHIDLEVRWQVALMEISYPHSWFNIPQESAYFQWRKKQTNPDAESEVYRQKFQGGYYDNLNQLKVELETLFRKIGSNVYFQWSAIQKRFKFQAGAQYHLRFFPPTAYMLGVKPGEWIQFDIRMACYSVDIKVSNYHLYCYSYNPRRD